MTENFIAAALACLALAGFAAWRDWRNGRRTHLDRVGIVSWPLVMVLALVGALIMAILAFRG